MIGFVYFVDAKRMCCAKFHNRRHLRHLSFDALQNEFPAADRVDSLADTALIDNQGHPWVPAQALEARLHPATKSTENTQ